MKTHSNEALVSSGGRSAEGLGKEAPDNLAMNVCQSVIASLESIGQAGVVKSQKVEEGGVQIMDVNGILDDVIGKIVRPTEGESSSDACACQPNRVTAGMVISSVVISFERSLGINGSSEFTSPNDHGLIQETAFSEFCE